MGSGRVGLVMVAVLLACACERRAPAHSTTIPPAEPNRYTDAVPLPVPSDETPTGTTSTQDDSQTIVYATRTGKKYHAAGCEYLRRSSIRMTLKDAKEKGLTPCSKCSPPD